MNRLPAVVEPLLYPLAGAYALAMKTRNALYDRELFKSFDAGIPVLSIGNLTAGGTGKTPLTAFLVEELSKRARRVGIVSRGYGGTETGPARVPADGSRETALRFGDEPTWLANRFPEVPVVVGADRVEASRALLAEPSGAMTPNLIIADDAFQHRRLRRSFDVVVVDATEPQWHYRSLPLGRMRESFASLARAHAVVFTKCNIAAGDETLRESFNQVKSLVKSRIGSETRLIEMDSLIPAFESLATLGLDSEERITIAPGEFKNAKVMLVSGIGRPRAFKTLVKDSTGAEVALHLAFPDHHVYTDSDKAHLEERAVTLGVDAILITEKDAAKLQGWKPVVSCWVSRLVIRPRQGAVQRGMGEFYEAIGEAIDRLVR